MAQFLSDKEAASLLCMIYVAFVDGHLSEEESEALRKQIEQRDLPANERMLIMEALTEPPTPADLAKRIPDAESRRVALEAAHVAALADGTLKEAESRALSVLASAFGFGDDEAEAIREAAREHFDSHGGHEAILEAVRRRLEAAGGAEEPAAD